MKSPQAPASVNVRNYLKKRGKLFEAQQMTNDTPNLAQLSMQNDSENYIDDQRGLSYIERIRNRNSRARNIKSVTMTPNER